MLIWKTDFSETILPRKRSVRGTLDFNIEGLQNAHLPDSCTDYIDYNYQQLFKNTVFFSRIFKNK